MNGPNRSRVDATGLLLVIVTGFGMLTVACQPESITGARERIADGRSETVTYRVPLATESYSVLDFLDGTSTVILDDGLVAVPVSPDTVRAPLEALRLTSDPVRIQAAEVTDPDALDLDELGSAVAAAEIRTAPIQMALRHNADAAVTLVDPTLALVQTDSRGEPKRDESGDLIVEEGSSGDSLTVTLGDTVEVPPDDSAAVEPDGAALIDELVKRLQAGEHVGIALLATVDAAAGGRNRFDVGDELELAHRALVGLDLVLPDSGVVVRRDVVGEGVGLDSTDVRQIQKRVTRAAGTLVVENGLPFTVRVNVAYVDGDRKGGAVFGASDRVLLDSLRVRGSPSGGGALDTVRVSVTGAELPPLLGETFTAGVRIRLLPVQEDGGAGALRAGQLVDVEARANMDVKTGSGS